MLVVPVWPTRRARPPAARTVRKDRRTSPRRAPPTTVRLRRVVDPGDLGRPAGLTARTRPEAWPGHARRTSVPQHAVECRSKGHFWVRAIDMALAWALALVVVIGAVLPVTAWLITRRAPPPKTAGRPKAGPTRSTDGSSTGTKPPSPRLACPESGPPRPAGQRCGAGAGRAWACHPGACRRIQGAVDDPGAGLGGPDTGDRVCGNGIFLLTDGMVLGILSLSAAGCTCSSG